MSEKPTREMIAKVMDPLGYEHRAESIAWKSEWEEVLEKAEAVLALFAESPAVALQDGELQPPDTPGLVTGAVGHPCVMPGCLGRSWSCWSGIWFCVEHGPHRDQIDRDYDEWHRVFFGTEPPAQELIYGSDANKAAFRAGCNGPKCEHQKVGRTFHGWCPNCKAPLLEGEPHRG